MADDLAAWLTQIWDEQEKAAREWQAEIEAEVVIPARMLGGIVDPWRELARIAADRQILAEHRPSKPPWPTKMERGCRNCATAQAWDPKANEANCLTLRLLASPYADRPGYREEWRPE